MKEYGKWLIRIASLCTVAGAFMGSHMAGSKDYSLMPTHGHLLVVGWLSLFVYGMFYRLFPAPHFLRLAKAQAVLSVIGAIGMPVFMLAYNLNRTPFTIAAFIFPAVLLLIGVVLFAFLMFFDKNIFQEK